MFSELSDSAPIVLEDLTRPRENCSVPVPAPLSVSSLSVSPRGARSQMPKGGPCLIQGLSNSRLQSLGEERAEARSLCQLLSASCSRLPLPFHGCQSIVHGAEPPARRLGTSQGSSCRARQPCARSTGLSPHTQLTTANPRLFSMCLFWGVGGGWKEGVIWNWKKEPV